MKLAGVFAILASTNAAVIAQPFVISTFAGGGLPFGPALNASFGYPQAIASDGNGNIYFAASSAVYGVDSNGILTRVAGTTTFGYSGDGGPAVNAQLDSPTALAADSTGNLYIAEGGGHIRKVGSDGTITTIAGNGVCHGGCYSNGSGDGGPAIGAQLFSPDQIAVDSAGNVYIAEWGTPRVRKISPSGIITTVVGNGNSGFSGDGGPATSAMIGEPWGLAIDSAGNMYISDDIGGDDYAPDAVHVRKVTADGIITTIAGTGAPGGPPNIADSGDGGLALSAQFAVAGSLAVDNAGNVYISDYSRVRKVSPDGMITTYAGNGQNGYSGDGGPAVRAQISGTSYGPRLAVDPAGNLYLADSYNNRIRKVSRDGTINTIAGNGIGCCFSGDDGPATHAQFYVPAGVAADAAGNVYVADTFNDRIRKIDRAGVITTVAGTTAAAPVGTGDGPAIQARLAWPTGLRLDATGNVYIADAGTMRVRRLSPDGTITTIAGSGPGVPGYGGDGGAATSAQLSWPKDIAFDAQGNIYIADTGNCVIRKVSPLGVITTIAGNGLPGYSGDGGSATNALLNLPSGLAIDSAGNIYVADTNNYRVRMISTSGIITTVAGNGTRGYSGDKGLGTNAQLTNPTGLALDRAGNLFIGDGASVRMLSPSGIITTIAGNGLVGLSGDGGPATNAQTGAWGLAFDSAGELLVADPWDNVIRVLK